MSRSMSWYSNWLIVRGVVASPGASDYREDCHLGSTSDLGLCCSVIHVLRQQHCVCFSKLQRKTCLVRSCHSRTNPAPRSRHHDECNMECVSYVATFSPYRRLAFQQTTCADEAQRDCPKHANCSSQRKTGQVNLGEEAEQNGNLMAMSPRRHVTVMYLLLKYHNTGHYFYMLIEAQESPRLTRLRPHQRNANTSRD